MEKVADEIVKSFEAQMGAAMENLERGEMAFDDLNGGWVGGWVRPGLLRFTFASPWFPDAGSRLPRAGPACESTTGEAIRQSW